MNRSVISCMIAAGVLTAGAGVAAAPAVADPVEAGTPNGADGAKIDVDRGPGQRQVRPKGRSGAGHPDTGRHGEWRCCPRICRTVPDNRQGGDNGLGLFLAGLRVPQRPPAVAVVRAAEPAFDVGPIAVAPAPAPAVIAPAESSAPAPFAAAGPGPIAAAPLTLPPVTATPLLAPAAPAPGPIPAQPPESAPASAELLRLGYPDELRDADLGKVAWLALPGLAAIAGMTALGGMLGYRQAKAGYVLRAAGASRFLQ